MKIEDMLKSIEDQSHQFYEAKLKEQLTLQDREWLEEQLLSYILKEKHSESFHETSTVKKNVPHETLSQRKERIKRIRELNISVSTVIELQELFDSLPREQLFKEGYLLTAEHKGLSVITANSRSPEGNVLLTKAKDLLFALLFCGEVHNVTIPREKREELTITLASSKAYCLENFMLAVTEFPVKGIWYDPEGVSDDENAMNTVMQVEFSDDMEGFCSGAVMSALKLINNLEINEEILYCRIEQASYSSLI